MYETFEDFARYASDREMESFGTKEFFDYHKPEPPIEPPAPKPAKPKQPKQPSIMAMPPAPAQPAPAQPPDAIEKLMTIDPAKEATERLTGQKVDELSEWKPFTPRERYADALTRGLVAIGLFDDENSAARVAANLMGVAGQKMGLGDIEPVSVFTEGSNLLSRGLATNDKADIALGAVQMLTAGIPVYGKALAQTARSVIRKIEKKFGTKAANTQDAAKPDVIEKEGANK